MANRTLNLNDALYDYMLKVSLNETSVLQNLRHKTQTLAMSKMQISPEQGQFMALLVKLIKAKAILEIGVFTGYSTLCFAEAIPDDGKIVACDINHEWTSIAEKYWKLAGQEDKINLHLAPALETLQELVDSNLQDTFDLAFIDADKINYRSYYEFCLILLRPGGLLLIDNVFWGGAVADNSKLDDDTNAIRELNNFLHTDSRVELSMIPVGDGLTLAIVNE